MESSGSEGLIMTEERKRKSLSTLVNCALVAVALAAWAANWAPAYSSLISICATSGVVVVAAYVLLWNQQVHATPGAVESDKTSSASLMDHERQVPVNLKVAAATELWRQVEQARYDTLLKNVSRRTFQQDTLFASLKPFIWHFHDEERHERTYEVAPKLPESYVVKVGLVTVSVRDGEATIEIAAKQSSRVVNVTNVNSQKIYMILAPDGKLD